MANNDEKTHHDLTFVGYEWNGREKWLVAPGIVMRGVHPLTPECDEFGCVIHNPSDHRMRDWPMCISGPGGVITRRCKHGVFHPDPDSLAYFTRLKLSFLHDDCDGCCGAPVRDVPCTGCGVSRSKCDARILEYPKRCCPACKERGPVIMHV